MKFALDAAARTSESRTPNREPLLFNHPIPSVLSQKLADKVSPLRATVPQPPQGRKIVAQQALGARALTPPSAPLSRAGGRGDEG
jgi:hypothetical protein